jgi:hypothetical protein
MPYSVYQTNAPESVRDPTITVFVDVLIVNENLFVLRVSE